jgi:hypothetical protein
MWYIRVRFRLKRETEDLWDNVVVSIKKELWDTVTTRDEAFNYGSDESELIRRWWRDPTKRDKVEIWALWKLDYWAPALYFTERYPGEYDSTLWELEGKKATALSEEEKKEFGREERREEGKEEERKEEGITFGLGALLLLLLLFILLSESEK